MATSTLTGRTFSSSTVSGLTERLDAIDAKDVKREAQLAAILVDTCYTVATWRNVQGLPFRDVRDELNKLRGTTGVRAEFAKLLPNTADKAQAAMINFALLIVRTGDNDALNTTELIKDGIRDAVAVMAGKGDDKFTVADLRELADSCEDVVTFARSLGHLHVMLIDAKRTAKINKIDTVPLGETIADDAPATPQELINNINSILNAAALRDFDDILELDVTAQLVMKIINRNKINKANAAAVAA